MQWAHKGPSNTLETGAEKGRLLTGHPGQAAGPGDVAVLPVLLDTVRLVTDAPLDEVARESWAGHRAAKVLTNAVVNRWQDGPDTAEGVRERVRDGGDERAIERIAGVDGATIERAIRGVGALLGQWAARPPGGTLRLSWPLPDGEVES